MDGYLQLDETAFEERFRPLRDEGGSWRDFDWTDPADLEAIRLAASELRLWTTVDVDGFVMLSSGSHLVNRLGYVISEVAFPELIAIEVYDPEDLDDWNEGLRAQEEWAESRA